MNITYKSTSPRLIALDQLPVGKWVKIRPQYLLKYFPEIYPVDVDQVIEYLRLRKVGSSIEFSWNDERLGVYRYAWIYGDTQPVKYMNGYSVNKDRWSQIPARVLVEKVY